MPISNDRDFHLYKHMAAELRQVAADIRQNAQSIDGYANCASRLEAYASAIDTELRVELV